MLLQGSRLLSRRVAPPVCFQRAVVPYQPLSISSRQRRPTALLTMSDPKDGDGSSKPSISSSPLSRIAALSRQLFSTSPFSSKPPSDSSQSGQIGKLQLGPDVELPVFEPHDPLRLPMQRLLLSLEDPTVLSDLTWMAKKYQLQQDMFLLSTPGPYARRLSLTFAALLQVPFEYVSMHRDVGESELLQQRSLRAGGSLQYIDGPVVRAMKHGSILVIDGVQRAERNVMPLLNNILENREANLADGTQLVPASRLGTLQNLEASSSTTGSKSRFIPVHPNFRVVAIGLPTPPYAGLPLDPPFKSRFQSRWTEGFVPSEPSLPFEVQDSSELPRELAIFLAQRLHELSSLIRYHDTFAKGGGILPETERLPSLPSTMLPLLETIVEIFPPVEGLVPPPTTKDFDAEPKEKDYPPPQDGALQVPEHIRAKVEARELEMISRFPPPKPQGLIAQETKGLLGAAWPALYTLDKARTKISTNLLESLGLDHGVGAGVGSTSQAEQTGTGLLGYQLDRAERVDEFTGRLFFKHAARPERVVSVTVPCGPLQFQALPRQGETHELDGEPIYVTPRLMSILTGMAQLHAAGRDIALLPSAFAAAEGVTPQSSSSTSTAIALFASLLGYPVESVWLWKDVGGNEIIMKRVTTPEGDTTFEPSPLLRGAMEAKIVHLAGIDVLGPTVGSLANILQDRTIELWEGGRATLLDAQESARLVLEGAKSNIGLGKLTPLHPSFRLIATSSSSKADWLNEEVSTLFSFVSPSPMAEAEEREIILKRSGCPEERLERLFVFVKRYREMSSDPALGLNRGQRLGTRSLIRIARRIARYEQTDLRAILERTLLVEFLPRTTREVVRNTLGECGIFARGSEGAFQYRAPEFMADPRIESGRLVFEDLNSEGRPEGTVSVAIFDAAKEGDAEGSETLIPSTGSFYNNPTQSLLARDLALDLQTDHLLLLGNQGTGKNKIIDRLCELLRRPREYIQLSRDSTVNSILQIVSLEGGQLLYFDSPLVRAIKLGRICVVDEADKCSSAVTAVFRSLLERGKLTLPDGRQVRPPGSIGSPEDIIVHPNFRCILLANRPGFPFLGNEFLSTLGEGFSPFAVGNPDLNSEVRLLKQAAPSVDEDLIKRLTLAFNVDLKAAFDAGTINYPYSLRELLHIVRHMDKYPNDTLAEVLLNTLSFDLHRPHAMETVVGALQRRGLDVKGLSIAEVREKKDEETKKAAAAKGKTDFDPKKAGRDTSLDRPKEGKVDPDNKEHFGGNTWRGGSGGRDTAGLGGRGGFERLPSGHQVKQISDELKRDVPDHIKEQARQMAREALAKKLAEQGMSQHEAATYQAYKTELEAPIQHLVNVLNELQANRKERSWVFGQQEGDLDERRLTGALAGDQAVFKRRLDAPPEIGAPMTKPKRIRFLVDCSASMYSMGYDGRLDREIKTVLMVMEAFNRVESGKFVYDIIGHSGEGHELPLVLADKVPENDGKRWKVMRDIISTTQFTMSGDNTVEALEHAVKMLPKVGRTSITSTGGEGGSGSAEEMDDYIVIALSDANLGRYGITAKTLERAMNRHAYGAGKQVKSAIVFIGGEQEAERVAKQLPGRAVVCNDLKGLPMLLSEILVAMVGRDAQ